MPQEKWALTLAGEVLFGHNNEGGVAWSEISRKGYTHLFYKSLKDDILKLLLLASP